MTDAGFSLRAKREELGLSQSACAQQVHVNWRTWARWESGERKMPEAALHLWCLINGIPYPPW
jgi:DNA-binding transcriptional regulator YiaG